MIYLHHHGKTDQVTTMRNGVVISDLDRYFVNDGFGNMVMLPNDAALQAVMFIYSAAFGD